MKLTKIHGIIRRRILVNYRIDPDVMSRNLPEPFRPKTHHGFAIGGVCLIRLESIRPSFMPRPLGVASENAAHRIAVTWSDAGESGEGVFIPRRDSNTFVDHLIGGRLFSGEHHAADFNVVDSGDCIELSMASTDGEIKFDIAADLAPRLPRSSIFASVREASDFFERGPIGSSTSRDLGRYDGLELDTETWHVSPLSVRSVHSSYFENESVFPSGSVTFDHALIMRDIEHQWVKAPDLFGEPAPG